MKVVVIGSKGKMGSLACQVLREQGDIKTVVGVTRSDCLADSVIETNPDVIIEMTDKDSVMANCMIAAEHSIPMVVGASGLSQKDIERLDHRCRENKIPALVVPNFSLAAVLMVQAAKKIAPYLSDCEIIEYHHTNKKDAPSATSIYTAKEISHSVGHCDQEKKMADTVGMVQNGIPIHSVRSSGMLARQDVVFAQKGETLTLSLSQIDRQAFMPGVIMSVKAVRSLGSGVHIGLERILEQDMQGANTSMQS
ncbi:MAG: 4-hydroxy-tetrahydrodipicolinate reductase [Pseudomonadota bacterium]|nr:4-hydroxy-tetrahydrodipicolinate reductase [Pseudomonadota bacterium]